MNVKQVIIMRKDLKVRRGKEIAQGSHAAQAFLTNKIRKELKPSSNQVTIELTEEEIIWINGKFTKVCLQVGSEEELLYIFNRAKEAGLTCELITDAGLTEFKGIPTNTAVGIGPNKSEDIDEITGVLSLY